MVFTEADAGITKRKTHPTNPENAESRCRIGMPHIYINSPQSTGGIFLKIINTFVQANNVRNNLFTIYLL